MTLEHWIPRSIQLTVAAVCLAYSSVAAAQDTVRVLQLADRGPRFLTAPTDGTPPTDARDAVLLRRTVTLDIDRVPLDDVLDAIGRQTGVRFVYNDEAAAARRPVSLHANNLSLAGALFELLLDSDLDVQVGANGTIAVLPRNHKAPSSTKRVQASGYLAGTVLDGATNLPLAGADVRVDRSTLGAITGNDGRYKLMLAPGGYTILVRRLGYVPVRRSVAVAGDSTQMSDFALVVSPAELDQVITTVTGDQRRAALGNTISTIPADSVVRTTAVSSFSDVVNARAPGVQVFNPGGLTGASPQINIRGQSNLGTLSGNQPLIYVDGVRISNDFSGNTLAAFTGTTTGRLNDISPQEIESIEIVKGPSAATLYGTNAANGVILIRTKRATSSRRQWNAFAETGVLTVDRNRFPENYYPWGHSLDGSNTIESCPLLSVAAAACAQDSVTAFTPLRVPSLTPLGTGNRGNYGLQLSQAGPVRYFVSGSYEGETGPLTMPSPDRALYEQLRGGQALSSDELHPNFVNKYSGRATIQTALSSSADLTLSAALLQNNAQVAPGDVLSAGIEGPGCRSCVPGDPNGWAFDETPGAWFVQRHKEDVTHFTSGATATWTPLAWLSSHATFGLDRSTNYEDDLTRAGEGFFFANTGLRANGQTNNTLYTADLGATATLSILPALSSRTSVGGQFNRSEQNYVIATAANLLPGEETLNGGATSSSEYLTESVVAGGYLEETLGYHDRLFLTGAGRVDGSAAFGRAFGTQLYPKASASWEVSRESFWPLSERVMTLRLRGAYGSSGVQPLATGALETLSHSNVFVNGQTVPGFVISQLGNADLKPEETRETEAGIDADLFERRLHIEATYYYKRTKDAIVAVQQGNSIGGTFQYVNVGAVRNSGWEASASLRVLDLKVVDWDVTANGSINNNRVLSLGPDYAANYGGGLGSGIPGVVAGYPLRSAFANRLVGWADKNGNGIIEPNEVVVDTGAPGFRGSTYPVNQLTVTSSIGLFRDRVRIAVQFDHRGDFTLFNTDEFNRCVYFQNCRATAFAHQDLAGQAAAAAASAGLSDWGYWQDGTFTRWRELSVTLNLPTGFSRAIRARSASVTLAGRNLALWTKYGGVDPEVVAFPGDATKGAYNAFGSPPPSRYLIARVNLGL